MFVPTGNLQPALVQTPRVALSVRNLTSPSVVLPPGVDAATVMFEMPIRALLLLNPGNMTWMDLV